MIAENSIFIWSLFWIEGSGNLQSPRWKFQKKNLDRRNKGKQERYGKSYCGGKVHHSDYNDYAK